MTTDKPTQKYIDFQGDCNCVSTPQYYNANWNDCGYLPDSISVDDDFFEDFANAKQYIIDLVKEMEEEAGEGGDEDGAEIYCHIAEDINLESDEFSHIANGRCFFVRVGEPPDPYFLHSGCDCCRNGLGNKVERVVGFNPETKEIEELGVICGECLNYFANGTLPED